MPICNARANARVSRVVNDLGRSCSGDEGRACRLSATARATRVKTELKGKENSCRPSATPEPRASGRYRAFLRLEHLRLELVALEQLVELCAVALRELRGLGHA